MISLKIDILLKINNSICLLTELSLTWTFQGSVGTREKSVMSNSLNSVFWMTLNSQNSV